TLTRLKNLSSESREIISCGFFLSQQCYITLPVKFDAIEKMATKGININANLHFAMVVVAIPSVFQVCTFKNLCSPAVENLHIAVVNELAMRTKEIIKPIAVRSKCI